MHPGSYCSRPIIQLLEQTCAVLNETLVSFLTHFPEPRTCCWETGRRESGPGTAVLVVTPRSSTTSNTIQRARTLRGEVAPSLPSTRLPRPTLQPMAVLCCGLHAACWGIREMKCYKWAFHSASFQVQREVLGRRRQREKRKVLSGRGEAAAGAQQGGCSPITLLCSW